MPITTMDSVAALVVIDLQKGIVGLPTVHPVADIIERTASLARAFRKRGLPVVLVNVTGMAPGRTDAGRPNFVFPPDWTELVPELDWQPEDHCVGKQRWGAFIGTDLHEYLQSRGVTQVLLTGVATSAGVESTARSAYDYGYNVVFIADAMTDRSAESHHHCLEAIFPRLGETDTTDNVLKLLG
jgi:nicotinamidase-related amidase